MCFIDPEECRCDCHNFPGGMAAHCIVAGSRYPMPCCSECPYCRRNIVDIESHMKQCSANPDNNFYASGPRRECAKNSIPNEILLKWARERPRNDGWCEDEGVPGHVPINEDERRDLETGSD